MTDKPQLDIDRARRLNQKLQLDQIGLFSISGRLLGGVAEAKLGFTMTLESIVWAPITNAIAAVFPLRIDLDHAGESGAIKLAEITVATRAIYKQQPGFTDADTDFLPDYLGLVGWMHVWPYARADVQAMSSRLGFPALVLPVLLAGQTSNVHVLREGEQAPMLSTTPAERKRSQSKVTAKKTQISKRPR